MIVVKRGKSWVVLDRYGDVVSRHRTRTAAVDASGGTYYVRPRRRYYAPPRERIIVEERVVRRRRRRNPWAEEAND